MYFSEASKCLSTHLAPEIVPLEEICSRSGTGRFSLLSAPLIVLRRTPIMRSDLQIFAEANIETLYTLQPFFELGM